MAAVEFAIILPVMIVMIFDLLETGRGLYTRTSLQNGFEKAGRYAAVHPDTSDKELENIAWGDNFPKGIGDTVPAFVVTPSTIGGVDFKILKSSMNYKMTISLLSLDTLKLEAHTMFPMAS